MGLFDLFSNDTAEQAASQRNAGLQAGYDQLSGLYGQGRDALSSGVNQGNNALQTYYGQGADALTNAYGNGQSALNSNYGNASGLYQSLINNTAGGASAYADATGANGQAGLARAMGNFQNSGQYGNYGFSLGQGLQALDRTHAAAGNLSSGNADTDTLNYATGLANQTYNSYVSGLSPYLTANSNAITGAAGVSTGLGNALSSSYGSQGNALGTLYGQLGSGLSSNATALGSGLNSSYQGQGTAANNNQTQQGASNAAATMNNYQIGNNVLGAIKTGASLFGAFA